MALIKIGLPGQGTNSKAILKFDFAPFNAQSSGFSLIRPKKFTPACPKMGLEIAQISDSQMILEVSSMTP